MVQINSKSATAAKAVSGKTAAGSAWLDLLQMSTGIGLTLFMLLHMTLVSSRVVNDAWMDAVAAFLDNTGLAQGGSLFIVFLFLLHFILAARKMPFRLQEQKTIWQHSVMLSHADTWLWVAQVVTALLILLLGSAHIWAVVADLPITAAKSAARMHNYSWFIFYIFFLLTILIHAAIGLYRIGVKWGFIQRRNRYQVKKAIFVTVSLIGIVMLLMDVLSFINL
ncbi:succinate dehydrogenase/fumarate reductase cytochrome b subunit [Desulfovulcanus sp.]